LFNFAQPKSTFKLSPELTSIWGTAQTDRKEQKQVNFIHPIQSTKYSTQNAETKETLPECFLSILFLRLTKTTTLAGFDLTTH
jgi:hypothetical protein